MASKQQQFVKGCIYHVKSPSNKPSKLEHLGNFKLNGENILMFKLTPKPRAKTKAE